MWFILRVKNKIYMTEKNINRKNQSSMDKKTLKNIVINSLFGNDTKRTHLFKQIGSNCCRFV